MLGLSAYGMGDSMSQQQALPTRRLRTWHPGMDDEEEVSDPESVKSIPMSLAYQILMVKIDLVYIPASYKNKYYNILKSYNAVNLSCKETL
ncbi:hypothetical protein EB796_001697 [Bugula neritina]|uniref:Uncharacterized protein n=1 Tax=Bugula neritina TaxID=10212 RepID=A0A7J7KP90_BUGNE|nr:hypothetical protein EB796_001697 [Bugula neritina]